MAMQIPLTGLVLLLASCGPSTGDPAPALVAQPAKLTLPQIPFGGKGEGQFSLHNTTSEVVSILGIGPTGCDCAEVKLIIPATGDVFEVSPQGMSVPLNPGMEAELHLTLDTSRYRDPVTWKTGRIPVILDRGPYLPLDYEADIWTPFWCEPWAIELGDVPMNQSASGFVMVRADEVADFSILAPEQMDGWGIQVTSNREEIKRAKSTLREGQQEALPELRYKVEVNSPPELPEGPFSQDFSLLTDLPGAPRIQFRAQGVGHPDLVISPSALHFRLAKNQRKAVIQVRAITPAHTLGPPRAVVEGSSPELWNIQVLPVHEGHQYTLEVNYLGEVAPPDSPVLKVHLDHPEQSLASIPLRFLTTQSSN